MSRLARPFRCLARPHHPRPARARRAPRRAPGRATLALAAITAALLAVAPTPARAADAVDSLARLSSDTHAAIVVPELSELNRVLGDLGQRYELPVPQMGDLLSAFKREAGMYAVNDAGPLLIAFENLDAAFLGEDRPRVFLLVPVSDYADFVESYDGDPDAEVTALTLPHHAGYARQLGDHALLGGDRDHVADYQPRANADALRDRLGHFGRTHLEAAAAGLYVDVAALRPALGAMLDRPRDAALPSIGRAMPDPAGDQGGLTDPLEPERAVAALDDPAMQPAAGGLATLIESVDTAVLAIEADDRGLALTQALAYAPDSPLAQLLPGGAAEQELGEALGRLPDEPFIFAAAMDARALGFARWLEQLDADAGQADTSPWAQQPEQAESTVTDLTRPLIERMRTAATAYYVPTQQLLMSGSLLNQVSIVRVDDPAAYREALQALVRGLDGHVPAHAAAEAGAIGQAEPISGSYINNALNIAGTRVDQYQLRLPPQSGSAGQPTGPAAGMLGMQGATGYIAATRNHIVLTTQPDPQLVRRALQAIEQGDGLGTATHEQLARRGQPRTRQGPASRTGRAQSPRPEPAPAPYDDPDQGQRPAWLDDEPGPAGERRARQPFRYRGAEGDPDAPATIADLREIALPASPVFEGYLSPTGLANTLELTLPMLELAGDTVPDDLPPLAVGLGVERDNLAGRLYMPHATAGFLIDLAMHFTAAGQSPDADQGNARR